MLDMIDTPIEMDQFEAELNDPALFDQMKAPFIRLVE